MQMTMPKPVNLPKATASIFANQSPMQPSKGKAIRDPRQGVKVMVNNPFQAAIGKMAMLAPRKY